MTDEPRERTRETDRTTIVHTDGGGGGGAGTVIAVVLVMLLIGLLLLVAFGGLLGEATEDVGIPADMDVNVNIGSPDMQMPEIDAPETDAPAPAEPAGNSG